MNQYKDTTKQADAPQRADTGQNEREKSNKLHATLDIVFLVAVMLVIFALAISCQPAHGNRLPAQALHEHLPSIPPSIAQAWAGMTKPSHNLNKT